MKLLALVLLLSSFSSLTLTEVVNSFKRSCPSFFIPNPEKKNDIIIPTIFTGRQYKKICQRWKNVYRFATVYDTERRIPVYSAYTFSKEENNTRNDVWKIEPQLDNITVPNGADVRDMMDSRKVTDVRQIKNQAVNSDYTGSGFTRGHVFPRSFAANQDHADSTFTLTNVAPQTRSCNQEWATQVEEPILKNITGHCKLDQNHRAYIVTGVVPGNDSLSIERDQEITERVNFPSHFWSAFCCTSKTNNKELVGMAYIAKQNRTYNYFKLWKPSIDKLNKGLKRLYKKKDFTVFPGLTVKDIKPHF